MEHHHLAPHILIVDDDHKICGMLAKFLQENSLRVSVAHNGSEMFAHVHKSDISLVVLDVMLPGENGLTLCRRLRGESNLPVILLTAVAGEDDKITGLELGADDYVSKPFNPRELLARIRSLLRRAKLNTNKEVNTNSKYHFAGWIIDTRHRTLTSPKNILVYLTSGEFDLLLIFVENAQRSISRDTLLDSLHGRVVHTFDRSIDVQVSRLRRKLERDPESPVLIKTIRNAGYFFTPDVSVKKDDPS